MSALPGELARRKLGCSGLTVTEIGFGSAPIGNFAAYRQPIPKAFWDALQDAGLIDRSVPLPGDKT